MRIMILGDLLSVHTKRLCSFLKENGHLIYGASLFKGYPENEDPDIFEEMLEEPLIDTGSPVTKYRDLFFLSRKLNGLAEKYDIDVISIQVVSFQYGFMFFLGKLKVPLISSFWGTEIWEERTPFQLRLQKMILNNSSRITAITVTMKEKIIKELEISPDRIDIVKYFILPIDSFKYSKKDVSKLFSEFDIPEGSLKVTIAYSSNSRHRHDMILEKMSKLDEELVRDNEVAFILPLTFGDDEWKEKIEGIIKEHPFSSSIHVMDRRLSDEEIVILRKNTDIFINLPTQDSLSATMFEHLQGGNVVITGDWLPYDILFESSAYLLKIGENEIGELDRIVTDIITDLDGYKKRCEKNRELIPKIINNEAWLKIFSGSV